MKINFKKVHLENFLSIGSADVSLNDGGYTLINGVNQNPDDMAKSNGSGKSTVFEAIVWCLTGETMRGSKDVVNIHGNDGALVELYFTIDTTEYKIIRTKEHSKLKTNLKIFINDEDKSGKGIRDTEKLLSEYIPDLTPSLIGSVIILGQGLPQRFTNNTPSGRKEVLEKLSKSDFMLEDLKERISNRLSVLKAAIRKCEDDALSINVKQQSYQRQIDDNKLKLDNLSSSDTLEKMISMLDGEILDCSIKINTCNNKLETLLSEYKSVSDEYTDLIQKSNYEANAIRNKFDSQLRELRDEFTSKKSSIDAKLSEKISLVKNDLDKQINDLRVDYASKNSELSLKNAELTKLKNIKDVCPTCGHKLEGVEKPDTSSLEAEIAAITVALSELKDKGTSLSAFRDVQLKQLQDEYNSVIGELNAEYTASNDNVRAEYDKALEAGKAMYDEAIAKACKNVEDIDSKLSEVRSSLSIFTNKKSNYDKELLGAKSQLSNLEATRKAAEDAIKSSEMEIVKLQEENKNNDVEKTNVTTHLDIVNKMNTVITRDFRGYLLVNIIDFINRKSKEYSMEVFETDKIDFKLDGNNIAITYDDKDYQNLSGGEKQKVDVIVQFALRDMLCKFLGFSSNILVLDEICDNVDSVGAEKLFNMISNKLSDVQDVFIISHHSDFQLPCDRQLTVIKDCNKISRIEYAI